MTTRWLARLVACLLALLTGNATPASASSAATTTNSSSGYVYDGPTIARVAVGEFETAAATPAQLPGSRDGCASSSAAAQEGSTTPSPGSVATEAASGPVKGQTVYRVYGGDSAAGGASWSPTNPGSVVNFRDAAGLPSGGASGATNTGQFVIEGTIADPSKVVLVRNALPLDGMMGGFPEYIIPNWLDNGAINITRISGANPRF